MSRRLLLGYVSLTLFVLAVLEVPLAIAFARNEQQALTARVERDATALASFAQARLTGRAGTDGTLVAIARRYAAATGGRVVIVDAHGLDVVDTAAPAAPAREFATRPELQRALRGEVATGVRHSATLGLDLLYVAVPVASSGVVYGAVRITYPTSAVTARVHRYWLILIAIAAVVLCAAAAIGLRLARSAARPLAALERVAEAAGAGDLTVRATPAGPPEVRELGLRFNEMVGRLEELVDAQEGFVADASHQLRTPLAAVRLRLENLSHHVDAAGAMSLERALDEVARLSRLIDGLLALARVDGLGAPAAPLDLGGAVHERIEIWEPLADERSVRLEADVGAGLQVLASPDRLGQVLDNLIENALEVAPAGSAIHIRAAAGAGQVDLHVIDAGPGMTADERARAFDRFWHRRGSGAGLGLAIARRLAAADGGQTRLDVADGGGVDAVVSLRRA